MDADPFLSLPPELIKLVLEELLPTTSLLPALLASPYLNSVFETHKSPILSNFVRKHVHPSILLDAVTAVSPVADESEIQAQHREYEEVCREMENGELQGALGLRRYQRTFYRCLNGMEYMLRPYLMHRKDNETVQNLPLSITIPLCRLLRTIGGLSNLLIARTSKTFKEAGYQELENGDRKSQPTEAIFTPPSSIENTRLQRAFFRFQIVSNVFHSIPSMVLYSEAALFGQGGDYEVNHSITDFLNLNSPWENEELLSVEQFLSSELGGILDRVQGNFVTRIVEEELANYRSLTSEEAGFDEDLLGKLRNDRFTSEDPHFSALSKCYESEQMGYLLSKGLNFLFTLFKADVSEQEHTVVNSYGRTSGTLHDVVRPFLIFGGPDGKDPTSEEHLDSQTDKGGNIDQCNEAYLWAYDYSLAKCGWADYSNCLLRAWAYVFWDNERLSRMGVSRNRPRCWHPDSVLVGEWDKVWCRNHEPSAEQLLKEMGFCLPGEKALHARLGTAALPWVESSLRWLDSITMEEREDEV